MLYPKNQEPTLSKDLFKNPTSEYRGAPFWGWNCKLQEDMLRRQIGYLKEMGFGGFHMHSRVGMSSKYLGDEFMYMVSSCVDEAKKQDMLAWLYDEDKWPSGYAGGFVTQNPQYVQRAAVFTDMQEALPELVDKKTAIENEKSYLLACYDIVLNARGELENYRCIDTNEPAVGRKWYVYSAVGPKRGWLNNTIYVDTLNKEAIDKFIDITHCRYKEVVGSEFGKAIPAIFTDEPKFWMKGNLKYATGNNQSVGFPWTPELPRLFEENTGLDVFAYLPELVWELPDGKLSKFRYLFHDFITELFVYAYVDNIGKWCDENGIMMTGHVMREDTLNYQTDSIGEAMRAYRGFQLPGIDTLIDQTTTLFNAAKQAQSSAHQYGRCGMVSELYGVTGWDFDFRHHKLQGDWEAALGVTVRVPHLSWVSMAGEAKRDYPSTFNYQSSWYKEYDYIENHFARVNTALTRGKPHVRVGVIHPIESCWMHFGPTDTTSAIRKHLDDCFSNICKWLLFGTIDFDYICESSLPTIYTPSDNAMFNVGAMSYEVVVVPVMETMRKTTVDALYDFARKGGTVIFTSQCPVYSDGVESDYAKKLYDISRKISFSEYDILSALRSYRDIEIFNQNGTTTEKLIYNMRDDVDCSWLFIAHGEKNYGDRFDFAKYNDIDAPLPENIAIKVRGLFTPFLYDTLSGDISVASHDYKEGYTVIYHTLYAETSVLLKLVTGTDEALTTTEEKNNVEELILSSQWDYCTDEPNVLLMDMAEYALDDGEFEEEEEILRLDTKCRTLLGIEPKNTMPQPWVFDDNDSGHTLTLRFTINSEIDVDNAYLAIEDAQKHKFTFNGKELIPVIEGYFTDEAIKTFRLPRINKGSNILTVKLGLSIRSNTEWCYILGDFGVRLEGKQKIITDKPEKIGFSPLQMQRMPFYGGNITYIKEIDLPQCDIVVKTPVYRGAAVKVALDGVDAGHTTLAPNKIKINGVSSGKHKLEIKLFGNRYNSFGPLHNTVNSQKWLGPDTWRTTGDAFCYEYRLKDTGILAAPVIEIIKK